MKHARFVVLLLLFAASSAFSASPSPAPAVTAPIITPTPTPPPQRTLKPEDYAQLRDVDEPNISPDGNSVVYVVKKADMEKDKLPGNLWLAKWDGSENRALTYGNKSQSHPRWSRDGKWIAFLSGREDENEVDQLWIMSSSGGEAQKFTDLKGNVDDFAWSPDSKRIVLVVHDPDPREPEKKEKEKKTVPPIVIDRFFFKHDIDGYLTDRWSHLQLLDLAPRKIDVITSGKHDEFLPAWSPDGNEIAFVTKRGDDPDRTENWDVYVIGAQPGAKERQVTTSPEADPHPDLESAPAWSPDGKTIAYIHGGDPKKIEYAVHTLAVIPAAGGEAKVLTQNLDRNVEQPHWSPDSKSVFVVLEDDGAKTLVRVPIAGGAPETVVGGRRSVAAYDVSKNGKVTVRASTPDSPYEIFATEKNNLRDLTKQNDAWLPTIRLGRFEETKFKSKDGTEIHGFVVRTVVRNRNMRTSSVSRRNFSPQTVTRSSCRTRAARPGAAKNSPWAFLPPGEVWMSKMISPRWTTRSRAAWPIPIVSAWAVGVTAAFRPTISSPAPRVSKRPPAARRYRTCLRATAPINTLSITKPSSASRGKTLRRGRAFPIRSCTPTGSRRPRYSCAARTTSTCRCSTPSRCIKPCAASMCRPNW